MQPEQTWHLSFMYLKRGFNAQIGLIFCSRVLKLKLTWYKICRPKEPTYGQKCELELNCPFVMMLVFVNLDIWLNSWFFAEDNEFHQPVTLLPATHISMQTLGNNIYNQSLIKCCLKVNSVTQTKWYFLTPSIINNLVVVAEIIDILNWKWHS